MNVRVTVLVLAACELISGCRKPGATSTPAPTHMAGSDRVTSAAPSGAPATAPTPATSPAPAPGPSNVAFDDARDGFALQYPSNWSPRKSEDYVLLIEPADWKSSNPPPRISMNVPDLPPHLPGMITLSRIQNGFLKHIKEDFGNVEVIEQRDVQLPDSKARLLNVRWRDHDQPYRQNALLMIHANRVYILRGRAHEADFEQARQAFESVWNSLEWK